MRKLTLPFLLIGFVLTSNVVDAQYTFDRIDDDFKGGLPPRSPTTLDTFLYFFGNHKTLGIEPWVTDGTQNGTKMIKDIAPGSSGDARDMSKPYNGRLYFYANDLTNGYELWVTDGTANGTNMVKDINPGSQYSLTPSPNFASVLGKLYFTADDGQHGGELWISDGTTNGTNLLKDIYTGTKQSAPGGFTEYKGKVYFTAKDSLHGHELWVTDGTTNGTQLFIDLANGITGSAVNHLTVYNNKLYFWAYLNMKHVLFECDGTTGGTKIVKNDLEIYSNSYSSSDIVEYKNKMYFSAYDRTTNNGVELFVSDGTTNGTKMVKNINPNLNVSYGPNQLTVVDTQLYFVADDGSNIALWVSDGTANGTNMINPAPAQSPFFIKSLIAYNNKLLFTARDTITNNSQSVWVSDGTATGTKMVKAWIDRTQYGVVGKHFIPCNKSLYIAVYDSMNRRLWKITDTTIFDTTTPPTNIAYTTTTTDKLLMVPNPTHNKVLVSWDELYNNAHLSIIDLTGKVVYSKEIDEQKKSVEVSLPNLPAGTYLLNLHHSKGIITERLLIE